MSEKDLIQEIEEVIRYWQEDGLPSIEDLLTIDLTWIHRRIELGKSLHRAEETLKTIKLQIDEHVAILQNGLNGLAKWHSFTRSKEIGRTYQNVSYSM